MARHGTECTNLDGGWFGNVPRVQTGMVDGMERCLEYGVVCCLVLARVS
jgi:hypothetical protein